MSRCANCDRKFIPGIKKDGTYELYCSDCDWKDSPQLSREDLEKMVQDFYKRQTENDN